MTSEDLLYSTGNYIQYLVITHNGKESEKEMCVCIHVCVTEPLCCTLETNTTLKINYILQFKKKKNHRAEPELCNLVPAHSSLGPLHSLLFIFIFILFVCFLGPHLWHMEVPRVGIRLELQLLAYATVTATWDLSASATYATAHSNARSLTQ